MLFLHFLFSTSDNETEGRRQEHAFPLRRQPVAAEPMVCVIDCESEKASRIWIVGFGYWIYYIIPEKVITKK